MKKSIKILVLLILLITITNFNLNFLDVFSKSSSTNYYWLNCYYSDRDWDTVTDFLLEDKIVAIGKIGDPYGSTLGRTLVDAGAIIEITYEGKVKKITLISNKKYTEKEDAIFLYRIFKESNGYILFAGSNPSPYRNRYSIGDNGFNKLYVIKVSPDFRKVLSFKAYYSPATDLRDVVYYKGFYFLLLYDITRDFRGIVAILKIDKNGEIISSKKFYLPNYQIRGLLIANEKKSF